MDINQTLENLRGFYQDSSLDISDCKPDPIMQFDQWLEESIHARCDEPNAFILSTILDQKPRARVLLLKGISEGDFIFYTNYSSAKGQEIQKNDHVSMTFLWLPLHRQIRIEGRVSKVDTSVSDTYFHKRPRGSQLGAIASPQSQKLKDRNELENFFHAVEDKYAKTSVLPRPENWGGYSIRPDYFEFWQGRKNRMHDRISYERDDVAWKLYRLAP